MASQALEQLKATLEAHAALQQGKPQPTALSQLWGQFKADQGLPTGTLPTDRQMVDFYTMAMRRLPFDKAVPNNPRSAFLGYAEKAGLRQMADAFATGELTTADGSTPGVTDAILKSGSFGITEALRNPEYRGRFGRGLKDGALQRLTAGMAGKSMPDPAAGNISQGVEGTGQFYGSILGELGKGIAIPAIEQILIRSGVGAPAALAARAARASKGGFTKWKDMKAAAAMWAALGAGSGWAEAGERDAAAGQARAEGDQAAPAPMGLGRKLLYTGASAAGDAANAIAYGATGVDPKAVGKAILYDSVFNAAVNAGQMGALSGIAGDSKDAVTANALAGALMGVGFGGLRAAGAGVKAAFGKPPLPAGAMASHLPDVGGQPVVPESLPSALAGLRRRNEVPSNYSGDPEFISREVGRPLADGEDLSGITPGMTAEWRVQRQAPVVASTVAERQAAADAQNAAGGIGTLLDARRAPMDAPDQLRIARPMPSHLTLTSYLESGPVGVLTRSGPEVGESFTGPYHRGDVSSAITKALDGSLGTKRMGDLYNTRRSIKWNEQQEPAALELPPSYQALPQRQRIEDPAFEGSYLDVVGVQEGALDDNGVHTGATTYALHRQPTAERPGEWAAGVPSGWSPQLEALHVSRQQAAEAEKAKKKTQQQLVPERNAAAPPVPFTADVQMSALQRALEDASLMRSHPLTTKQVP